MRARALLALFTAFLPVASSFAKDEHLTPEESVFSRSADEIIDSYEADVVSVFREVHERGVFGRVVVLPSFSREYAVAIKRDGGDYKIIYLLPDTDIWSFQTLKMLKADEIRSYDSNGNERDNADDIAALEAKLPDSITDVMVERCDIPIDRALGDALYVLWGEMLFRTRYVDYRPVMPDAEQRFVLGADGVTYHFSFQYGSGRLTGQIWSPEDESITGRFVAITDVMRDACTSKDSKLLADLAAKVSDLRAELARSRY